MNKKTVKMSETRTGSPDGIAVHRYLDGDTYTLPAELADIFTENGWATLTDTPAADEETPVSPYAGLSDEELAAKVLEHDPDADPASIANAIDTDRAAVIGALPTPTVEPEPKPATPRPRRRTAAKKK